jgi:GTPase SAR1 family protein
MSDNESDLEIVHIIVIGDCLVGKTNLILSYSCDQFNTEHIPTVFDHFYCET